MTRGERIEIQKANRGRELGKRWRAFVRKSDMFHCGWFREGWLRDYKITRDHERRLRREIREIERDALHR
jgi:hypothetical protein